MTPLNYAALQALNKVVDVTLNKMLRDTAPDLWYKQLCYIPPNKIGSSFDQVAIKSTPPMRAKQGKRIAYPLEGVTYTMYSIEYEKTIGIPQLAVERDALGLYMPTIYDELQKAVFHPQTLALEYLNNAATSLCYDGQYFLDTDHPVGATTYANIITAGSTATWGILDLRGMKRPLIFQKEIDLRTVFLNKPDGDGAFWDGNFYFSIEYRAAMGYMDYTCMYASDRPIDSTYWPAAKLAFEAQTDDFSVSINRKAGTVIIPPSLEYTAKTMFDLPTTTGGAPNPYYNDAKTLIIPGLGMWTP